MLRVQFLDFGAASTIGAHDALLSTGSELFQLRAKRDKRLVKAALPDREASHSLGKILLQVGKLFRVHSKFSVGCVATPTGAHPAAPVKLAGGVMPQPWSA